MKKILQRTLWAIGFLLLHFQGLAQEATITGRVVAVSDNSPLPGVSVTIKGTTRGTVTDADGKFVMAASPSDVLLFSFIGMETKEVTVGSSQTLTVTLNDSITTLGEVVIAEFGIARASRAMGSEAQTVAGKEVAESGRDNLAGALMGRVSGLNVISSSGSPGASSTIQLRSITSISGNNQPLFVVDGVPMNNSTYDPIANAGPANNSVRDTDYSSRGSDFNPEDIESITILKGPAAAALYGSNASNGAIIITTKKGSGKGGKVTYSNQFRWDKAYGYPEFQTKYGNGSYGTTNQFYTSQFGAPYPEGTKLYDNLGAVLQTGITSKHNISVEGGTEKASLRASASYLDQTGVIKTTDYSRFNLSLAGKAEVNKWMSVEAFMQYTSTTNTKAPRGQNGTLGRAMLWPQVDNMADYLDADGEHMRMPGLYTDTDLLNPLFGLYNNKLYDESDRILSTATVAITPFENAFIRAQLGWDLGVSTYEISTHPYYSANNAGNGAYNITKTSFSDPTVNILGGYSKQLFQEKLSVSAQVGYHQLENGIGSVSSYGSGFLVPGFQSINNTNPTSQTSTKVTTRRRIQAVSGQLELGYNNLAFITLRARNDWSSTLPKANNSYFYPAIEGSLVVSDLSFMQNLKPTVGYLKLRGSVAQVGRDAGPNEIDPQLIATGLTGGGYRYGNTGPNKNLLPEITTSKEIGVETRFLNDRINADFTHFWTNCSDQIVKEFRLSYATGYILNTLNVGTFETWGWEGHIDADIIRSASGVTWNVGINASRTNSEVVSLPANVTEYYNPYTFNIGNTRNGIRQGYPVTTISGTAFARNQAGDILINPTTGLPLTDPNQSIIGNREPKLRFGITSSVTYKGISLSAVFAGRYGATVLNGTKRLMMQRGVSWESVDLRESGPVIFNGVLKDGNEESETPTRNNISVNYGTQSISIYAGNDEDWLEHNVNYLRLQEVRLAYRLPSAWLSKISVSSAQVYVTGNDLFTWTNYSGIDAVGNTMSAAAGGSGGEGFDIWGMPSPRGISVGLGVTF
jgi:TonB-linked SusC/RagA family outer membrane protein